ncbi:MAG: glycosyltransferase family 2 protein [Hyphomicrobiales bacterium]|nr:glycosyltransferase family 2 protein [Hyphomicrobiales bacterium]OQW81423.1 MAG: dolichol-phosphate mannosyltransferase [Proteobacteria bacterium ST_bin15]
MYNSVGAEQGLRVSVTVPVKNERDNLLPLITEIEAALAPVGAYEIIYVDDASDDGTSQILAELQVNRPHLRVIRHEFSAGKSGAVRTAVRAARAPLIATLDGDGQNNPAYLPAMIAALEASPADTGLVQGERQRRRDTLFKRVQSRIANAVRRLVLSDVTSDTGCGLTVVRRDVYLQLPYFQGLHRFVPALVRRDGYAILIHSVADRPRLSGQSHYGFFDRLWVGLFDMAGVWWLIRRRGPRPNATERRP